MKTPWWKFWEPTSGAIGGLIYGMILNGIIFAIARLAGINS